MCQVRHPLPLRLPRTAAVFVLVGWLNDQASYFLALALHRSKYHTCAKFVTFDVVDIATEVNVVSM